MTTVEISLPDSLAKEAAAAGLFAPESIERMVREAIRRRARASEKLKGLPPERVATGAAEPAFARLWENDADAAYDKL
jgi:hypothetical protein